LRRIIDRDKAAGATGLKAGHTATRTNDQDIGGEVIPGGSRRNRARRLGIGGALLSADGQKL